jgi:hypothetical protein
MKDGWRVDWEPASQCLAPGGEHHAIVARVRDEKDKQVLVAIPLLDSELPVQALKIREPCFGLDRARPRSSGNDGVPSPKIAFIAETGPRSASAGPRGFAREAAPGGRAGHGRGRVARGIKASRQLQAERDAESPEVDDRGPCSALLDATHFRAGHARQFTKRLLAQIRSDPGISKFSSERECGGCGEPSGSIERAVAGPHNRMMDGAAHRGLTR